MDTNLNPSVGEEIKGEKLLFKCLIITVWYRFYNLDPQSSSPEPSYLMTVNCVVRTSGKRSSFLLVPKEKN